MRSAIHLCMNYMSYRWQNDATRLILTRNVSSLIDIQRIVIHDIFGTIFGQFKSWGCVVRLSFITYCIDYMQVWSFHYYEHVCNEFLKVIELLFPLNSISSRSLSDIFKQSFWDILNIIVCNILHTFNEISIYYFVVFSTLSKLHTDIYFNSHIILNSTLL